MPIDFDDEDISLFEEEEHHGNPTTNKEEEEEGPREPIQAVMIPDRRKRPNWLKDTLENAKGHEVVKGTFREGKRTKRYSGYVAYMTKLIEAKPNTFEEAAHQEVWKKAMQEEY